MGINYNPGIVTSNLVFLNDGANPRIPAFGNTTLTYLNGVTAPTDGYYTFDGINDGISISNNNLYNISWTSGKSIFVSGYMASGMVYSGVAYYRGFLGNIAPSNDLVSRVVNLYIYVDATGYRIHFSAGTFGSVSNYLTASTQNWYIWGITQAPDGTLKFWQNGSIVGQTTQTLTGYGSVYTEYLGRNDTIWQGRIGFWQIYNTCLTDAQVVQNYNAMRGRYGI